MTIHVDQTLDIGQLPQECIDDCTRPGEDAGAAVEHWLDELGLTVDRLGAIACLKGYGAWEREELEASSDTELAGRILWLACGDFKEFQYWRAANPDKPDHDADCGSTVFALE